jgi:hypothetical protein
MRLQLDIPEHWVGLLESLKNSTGCRTHKDLFNAALTLFKWAVEQRAAGLQILAVDNSGDVVRELQMPALEAAALRKKPAAPRFRRRLA